VTDRRYKRRKNARRKQIINPTKHTSSKTTKMYVQGMACRVRPLADGGRIIHLVEAAVVAGAETGTVFLFVRTSEIEVYKSSRLIGW